MGSLLLTLLPFLIGPVITLVVFIFVFRVSARVMRGEPAIRAPRRRTIMGFVLAGVVVASLFFGFVGAAIIGALAPRSVMFAADMACPGGVQHNSYDYSYKPGQRGTSQEFRCDLPGQASTDITGTTFVYAGLSFSAAALIVLLVLWALLWPRVTAFFNRLRTGGAFAASGKPDADSDASVSDLITSVMGAVATRAKRTQTASVFVNGERVDLSPNDEAAVHRTVADAFGAEPHEPRPHRSLSERLQELEALYRAGTISRSEYDEGRARLLSEI